MEVEYEKSYGRDIHGMYNELIRVLVNAGYSDFSSLICLGDHINRENSPGRQWSYQGER